MLQQLIKEASCSLVVQNLLINEHVACDQLLPAVKAALEQSAVHADCLEQITDKTVQGCSADVSKVQEHRAAGNAAYKLGDHAEALRHYTEALRWLDDTSTSGSLTASQLHSNRSLCLLRLKVPNQKLAFQEADAAVIADPTSYKALYRRATAGIAVGNVQAARKDISTALQLLQGATTASGQAGGQEIINTRKDFQALLLQINDMETSASGQNTLQATDNVNTSNVYVSDCSTAQSASTSIVTKTTGRTPEHLVTVAHSEEAGRHLVAARDMPAPCDVWVEKPAAGVLAKSQRPHRCWHCMQHIPEVAVGIRLSVYCKHCPMVQYCSVSCREEDPFHQPRGPECGVAWARVLPEHALLAVRLARARKRFAHLAELSNDSRASATSRTDDNQVAYSGRESAVEVNRLLSGLMTHQAEQRPSETALEYCVLATIASDAYNRCSGQSKAQKITAAELLSDLLRVEVNGIALRPQMTKGQDRWGTALYPMLSCANHSCRPNITLRFEGSRVTARLTRPAITGTPLTISYGPQLGESLIAERERYLQRHYFFHCSCTACSEPADQEVIWGCYRCSLACPKQGCPGGWQLPFPLQLTCSCQDKEQLYHPPGQLCRCDVCGSQIQHRKQLETTQQLRHADTCAKDAEKTYEDALAALKLDASITSDSNQKYGTLYLSIKRAAEKYREAVETTKSILHAANLQLGQLCHTAAQSISTLLACSNIQMTTGPTQPAPIDSSIVCEGLQLARQVVELYKISLNVLQLHYPLGSMQLAHEQNNLAGSLLVLSSLLEVGSQCSAHSDKNETGGQEHLTCKKEAVRLKRLAYSVLRLHFGHDVQQEH